MKKRLIIPAFAATLLVFASCKMDNDDRHQLSQFTSTVRHYADETGDTIGFYTFDSWTVTSSSDWVSVDGQNSMNITHDANKQYAISVPLKMKPNTSGRTRVGYVSVVSYEYSYMAPVVQFGFLNISRPEPSPVSYYSLQSNVPDSVRFSLSAKAMATTDTLTFSVRNSWQLSVIEGNDDGWLTLGKTQGADGKNQVEIRLDAYTDTEKSRSATLRLTSGTVSNDIVIEQEKAAAE